MDNSPLLAANNIIKIFNDDFYALNDVSLALYKGKTLGVVGESGSGKSTLGEIIGDLQQPTQGDILFNGRNIHQMSSEEYRDCRLNVQFIFQSPKESLNPMFTVKKAITEPLDIQKISYTDAYLENVLKQVRIPVEFLNKRTSQLSGGQAQRVAIARSMALKPDVIVCDEVTSALDVSVQSQILDLLKDLQAEHGTAYLFITHDIGVVYEMSDEIIVLKKGVIQETGTAEQVVFNPQSDYTQTLMNSSFYVE